MRWLKSLVASCACAITLCFAWQPGFCADENSAIVYLPHAAELSMLGALVAAKEAVSSLEVAESKLDRDIAYATLIDSLTALYQLHGLQWAKEKLEWAYAQPDCPSLITGFSADGRVYLRLQTLELRNPAFDDFTVVLCQLNSHTALDLQTGQPRNLELELADGTVLTPEQITEEHPLWSQLESSLSTFVISGEVPSGFTPSFKQVFAIRGLSINRLAAVRLVWGQYTISLGVIQPGQGD